MKLTNYKFWYIRRDDDGFITEAAIRFWESEIQKDICVMTKRLGEEDLKHLVSGKMVKDSSNYPARRYRVKDFGKIKSDDELRAFLNQELGKDKSRTPVDEQK